MRVEVAYRGRIEAFDTDRFTEAQPFSGKSMLADLTLDYADVEKKGLWLTAHCYAANEAYRAGDLDELRRILREWEHSPDAVAGDDTAAALVRAIRRAAQLRERIAEAEAELEALAASELNQLRERAEADPALLARLRTDLEAGLSAAQDRLGSSEEGR